MINSPNLGLCFQDSQSLNTTIRWDTGRLNRSWLDLSPSRPGNAIHSQFSRPARDPWRNSCGGADVPDITLVSPQTRRIFGTTVCLFNRIKNHSRLCLQLLTRGSNDVGEHFLAFRL